MNGKEQSKDRNPTVLDLIGTRMAQSGTFTVTAWMRKAGGAGRLVTSIHITLTLRPQGTDSFSNVGFRTEWRSLMYHTPDFILLNTVNRGPTIIPTNTIIQVEQNKNGSLVWNTEKEYINVRESVEDIMKKLVKWSNPC